MAKTKQPETEWVKTGVGSRVDGEGNVTGTYETWELMIPVVGAAIYKQAEKRKDDGTIEPQWEGTGEDRKPVLELGPDNQPILLREEGYSTHFKPFPVDPKDAFAYVDAEFKGYEIDSISVSAEGGVRVRVVAQPAKTVEELEAEVERLNNLLAGKEGENA